VKNLIAPKDSDIKLIKVKEKSKRDKQK